MDSLIQAVTIYALPVIFAITLHEAAHGYVAKHFGDTTAYVLGRVSLNPVRHIDPVGTIAVPLVLLVLAKLFGGAGILFGWAKPVPVNFGNLRQPKRDMLWVAAAGPGANLAMALFWALMAKIAVFLPQAAGVPLVLMGQAGVQINLILMVLNLLPIPPLDGGRIAVSLLPSRAAYRFSMLEPYGIMILLALLLT
ncbi:MAG TPA: site-2 protease family protein, partial [Burkholderiales bacterium]|nr:site-2 protease family protein [Burkholderiales bacterium]